MEKTQSPNASLHLPDWSELKARLAGRWPGEPAAMLIVHGIGHQRPLQTLDAWARGLADALAAAGHDVHIEHRAAAKHSTSSPKNLWFDNHLRLTAGEGSAPIDLYEYYWAHCTEDRAGFRAITRWLGGVVRGARAFYAENKALAASYEHAGTFFFKEDGTFRSFRYWLIVGGIGTLLVLGSTLWAALRQTLALIPFLGPLLARLMDGMASRVQDGHASGLTNLLGDVVIYNTSDEKSAHYAARQKILNGAVSALCYLLEPREGSGWAYRHVLLAGHSLGSQISFDALNRINFLVQQGALRGFRPDGSIDPTCPHPGFSHISGLFAFYATFGSPLDKIAFFLRDRAEQSEVLRAWMLANFHGFKQRPWTTAPLPGGFRFSCGFTRLLDQIPWVNYHDSKDAVSGALDFYHPLTNVDCGFHGSGPIPFTHGDYWTCRAFFADVLARLFDHIAPSSTPPHHPS